MSNLPFTQAQFLENFSKYNEAVFPMQFVLFVLAIFSVYLAMRRKNSERVIMGILTFFWLWMGVVYHLTFFTNINKAAFLFGSLFIVQGLLFAFYGVYKKEIFFDFTWNKYSKTGLVFMVFALFIYPILGYFFGHRYPQNPTFGLPCPTTIFSFGMLLLSSNAIKKRIIIIPLLWSFVGFSAALILGIHEDIGLLVVGVLSSALLYIKSLNKKRLQLL